MSCKRLGVPWVLLAVIVFAAPERVRAQPVPGRQPATLRILLPEDDAKLTVDGKETKQTGTERTFTSPPLEPGRKFTYTVTTVFEPNNYTTITRTKEVSVRAGAEVEVDMNEADPKHPDRIVIRWVPTPQQVVVAMLKLGNVGPEDVVYDLGCGDGRIVITAVKEFHVKHAVGIDLDPKRIAIAKERAKKEGVEDKVEFRQGDVLDIKDLSAASVVTLYLADPVNLRLRPILQKTLKPGSRVVSHRFTMGDWKPLKTETITDEDGIDYDILLWIIGEGQKEPTSGSDGK
ncbi:MAG: TIGR03000 domain-containing protein [Planctomycetes bacterium]|nr:TIGR03000 domain-containing protein [Planctomycetota bacterium]